jgi:hypothetical protein
MKYTSSDFIRLLSEIEAQGGEHREDSCIGQEYPYTKNGNDKTYYAPGCEDTGSTETMFYVAYDPYATVVVPEPILEPDPDRDGRSHRSKKDEDGNALFTLVEREAEIPAGLSGAEPGLVAVCAGHDNLGAWPRFAHVIQDGSA